MKGRKRKPTVLHELEGTFNPTRHRDRATEPEAPGELLAEAPDWLTQDQQTIWRYAVEFAPVGVLKAIDYGILATWVIAFDQHRAATIAQAKLDVATSLPLLTKDKQGNAIVSPYVGIINRAGLRMIRAAAEMGFTPASRPRLVRGDQPPGGESEWAQLMVIEGGRK